MKLLLDTHVLLWFLNGDKKLSKQQKQIIESTKNIKFISIASIWEISIKLSLNKLKLPIDLESFIQLIDQNGFLFLPIELEHILEISNLEFIHRDPFDRIIIAQSKRENLTLLTNDENIVKYDIKSIQ
jgi:PIN domain nuclease of toxin-antitoxin system